MANTIDVVLVMGLFVGAVLYLVIATRLLLEYPWLPAALSVGLFALNLVNLVCLPSWVGGSVGQLLTGLVQIRGADGTRPSLRETGRVYFRDRRVFRIGGVHTAAPWMVVVRRQDTVEPMAPRRAEADAHTTGSYLEH
ncbi:hypothetical protein ACFO5K_23105 [Nocardia halotolerans]|uniref:RDD family protein n=1 Tax=Nocardia halotolerans TaxID=1755878 RepID=A0ABV8VMG8_9NOCA